GGHGALARPELEQRVEEQALDADEDDQRDREDQPPQRVDLVGVGRAAVLGAQQVRRGQRRRGRDGHQRGEDGPSEGAATADGGGEAQGGAILFRDRSRRARHGRAQWPPKAAWRFWTNAVTPSTKSPEPAISCWISASSS